MFSALEFLKHEEVECLTEYGKGLLNGLLDPQTFHQMTVVHKSDYDKLKKEYDKLYLRHEDLIAKKEIIAGRYNENISKLEKEIEDFENEVDFSLSESNSQNYIEI